MSTTQRIANAQTIIRTIAGPASIGRATAMDLTRLSAARTDLRDGGWDGATIHKFERRAVMAFRHNQARCA